MVRLRMLVLRRSATKATRATKAKTRHSRVEGSHPRATRMVPLRMLVLRRSATKATKTAKAKTQHFRVEVAILALRGWVWFRILSFVAARRRLPQRRRRK